MKKLILATLVFCLAGRVPVTAQTTQTSDVNKPTNTAIDSKGNGYILEIQPGKKVLHIDMLSLPPTTTLSQVLDLFPELLSREGDTHLSNYDLQINDVSTSASAENIMNSLFVSEIKIIEVCQSPDMSQKVNGQGGVINIEMKDPEYGVSGNAMVLGSSMVDAMPSAKIAYKTDKLLIRGSAFFEYYHPLDNTDLKEQQGQNVVLIHQADTTNTNYYSESARFYLKYSFNPKGSFETWLIQDYQNNNDDSRKCRSSYYNGGVLRFGTNEVIGSSAFMINSNSKYKQDFNRGGVQATFQYIYKDKGTNYWKKLDQAYQSMTMDDKTYSHDFKLNAKGKYQVVPTSKTQKLELTAGVNFNYNITNYDYKEDLGLSNGSKVTNAQDALLSPYLEADCIFGPVALKGGINYQYRNGNHKVTGNEYNSEEDHDFTANIKAGWQIAPHHHLSFLFDRSIRRPSLEQLYPYITFKPFSDEFIKGNYDLNSETLHTADLNYIYDTKIGEHSFIANVSGQYIRTDNIITPVTMTGIKGVSDYITYVNDGFSNIFSANAMLHYNYQIFQMQLTANVFRSWQIIGGVEDTYTYYNLAVIPRLNFPHEWKVFLKIQYYSPVDTKQYRLSDYSYGEVNVSKTWKNLTVSIFACDLFHKTAIDVYTNKELDYHAYNLHRREIGASISYNF